MAILFPPNSVHTIESALPVELILNLAWTLLTAISAVLWIRYGSRRGASRRSQLVALAVLMMVLFPVISVSDDLQTLQNPAEADCCVRRDHVVIAAHSILPAVIATFRPATAEPPIDGVRFAEFERVRPFADLPALTTIEFRPPPRA